MNSIPVTDRPGVRQLHALCRTSRRPCTAIRRDWQQARRAVAQATCEYQTAYSHPCTFSRLCSDAGSSMAPPARNSSCPAPPWPRTPSVRAARFFEQLPPDQHAPYLRGARSDLIELGVWVQGRGYVGGGSDGVGCGGVDVVTRVHVSMCVCVGGGTQGKWGRV